MSNKAYRYFCFVGITAHVCPECLSASKRLRKPMATKNSLFIQLGFNEQAQIALGRKITKRVVCSGEGPFGNHAIDVIVDSVGKVPVEV